jgi:hypothetical protein
MMHNLDTIYRKLRLNAKILDSEVLMLVKSFDERLQKLEGEADARLEKPSTARQGSSKVSKKKVSSS